MPAPYCTYQLSMSRLMDALFSWVNSTVLLLGRYTLMNPRLLSVRGKESAHSEIGQFLLRGISLEEKQERISSFPLFFFFFFISVVV